MLSAIVVIELRPSPFVDQNIFVTVVVIIAPDGSHGHARVARVDVGEAGFFRNIAKRSVVHVAVQGIVRTLAAVGGVEIVPAVPIEIDDRYRGSHRGDLRHDVVEPRIEFRSAVFEMDTR